MEAFIYLLLILTSVVGLAFIIERGLALRWERVLPAPIEAAVRTSVSREDLPMLRQTCEQHASPLGRLLLQACDHLNWPKGENVDALQTLARKEIVKLERGLVVLEICVGIAPLMGLVGTILGMMALFSGVGEQGLGDTAALARGIGLILNATLMGLLIAIPCLIFWCYYSKKVETMTVEMETICDQFIRRQYRLAAE